MCIRDSIRTFYENALAGVGDIQFQQITANVLSNNWMITIETSDQKGLIAQLTENKIQCRPFWRPMNQLRMYKNDIYVQDSDVSDKTYQTCLSIPCSSGIKQEELSVVAECIKGYYKNRQKTLL